MDLTSYLLGKKAGGGGGSTLQVKSETVTSNGSTTINPDEGYDGMSKLNLNVNVQPDLESKSVTISSNTTTTISPTEGKDGLSSVEVVTNVPQGITPTGTINITTNGTHNVTNYASANVNVSGGGSAEKDANFYDYDGTLVYAYTAQEFAELTELPANPTHTGLTAQGWNWTLSDAQACVSANGWVDIGQKYIASDNKNLIKISLPKTALNPYLGLAVNGSVIIDWGDGSATDTLTGSSASFVVYSSHTYATAGDYTITIVKGDANDSVYIIGYGSDALGKSLLLVDGANSTPTNDQIYRNAIKEVFLSTIQIGTCAFNRCFNLKNVVGASAYGNFSFASCLNLECIVLLNSSSSYSNCFNGCVNLKRIFFSSGTLGTYTLYNCSGLERVALPTTFKILNEYFFYNCSGLKKFASTNIGDIKARCFAGCRSLKNLTIKPYGTALQPSAGKTIGEYAFVGCSSLEEIALPSKITTYNQYCFSDCHSLKHLVLTSSTTTISANSFAPSLEVLDFRNKTSVPTMVSLTGISPQCKIVVPDDLYTDFITDSDFSSYASQIMTVSDYDAL